MSSTVNNLSLNDTNFEGRLLKVFEVFTSENEVKRKRREEIIKSTGSVAISAICVTASFFGMEKLSQWFRVSDDDESSTMDRALGIIGAGVIGIFCWKRIVLIPKTVAGVRKFLKEDRALVKMTFSESFDVETTEALLNVVQICPITMNFPRFPVQDRRLDKNGQERGQTFEWIGVQIQLALPPGERSCKAINYAKHEDFDICGDLSYRIHEILFASGRVFSEDPIEALLIENELLDKVGITIEG